MNSLANTLSSTSLSSFSSFTYDGVFNMTGFSGTYGSGSSYPNGARTFGYDSKDRLTSSSIPTSGSSTTSSTFGFDSAGNRTSVNSTTIPFNSDNQLTTTGFSFDGNGNPTTYGGTSLTFDPENRMTAFGSTVSNSYRADGLRASKTNSSGTTYFLYDGAEPVVEMNSSGTVTATNVFAPDGLVARQPSSATTEYVFDQQGNVADRTNTSGAIQSVTQYDAWGNEEVVSGTVTDPFGYNAQSGYYLDRETGLYLCQHRFYDPSQGRWLNRDPIGYGGGTNLYGYCGGAPMGWADPEGLRVAKATAASAYLDYGFWRAWMDWYQGRTLSPGWVRGDPHKFGEGGDDEAPTPEFPTPKEFARDLAIDGGQQALTGLAEMEGTSEVIGIGTQGVAAAIATGEMLKVGKYLRCRDRDGMKEQINTNIDGPDPDDPASSGIGFDPNKNHPVK